MRAIWISVLALVLLVPTAQLSSQQVAKPAQGAKPAVDFAQDVQPIFKTSCYGCHAGAQPQAGLRLDVRSMALTGSIGGPVILPGNSKDSSLIHRVSGLGGLRPMPLTGTPLTADQVALLTRWVDEGAKWPDAVANEQNAGIQQHWAYVKPVRRERFSGEAQLCSTPTFGTRVGGHVALRLACITRRGDTPAARGVGTLGCDLDGLLGEGSLIQEPRVRDSSDSNFVLQVLKRLSVERRVDQRHGPGLLRRAPIAAYSRRQVCLFRSFWA